MRHYPSCRSLAFVVPGHYTEPSSEAGRTSEWARAHFFVGGKRASDRRQPMELERIRDAAERAARTAGVEIVDVEWKIGKQRFLRVYIDKPGGVSHRDCEAVSEQLGVLLDVEDLVPGPRYILEVSSPGLDRKLTKAPDFERFTGRLARISTVQPVENSTFFEGRLAGYSDGLVKLDVKGRIIELPLSGIRKANLVVEW